MKAKYLFPAVLFVLSGWLAALSPAGAAEVVMDNADFSDSTPAFFIPIDVTGPATLAVTLSDYEWQKELIFVSNNDGAGVPFSTPGSAAQRDSATVSESYDVGPGIYFVRWLGFNYIEPSRLLGLTVVNCPHEPVPLPTSVLLLASGLAALLFWTRGRRTPIRMS